MMKKCFLALSGLAVALLVILGISGLKAQADGDHADHCICGGISDCLQTAKTYGHQGDSSLKTAVTPADGWVGVNASTFLTTIQAAKNAGKTEVYIYLTESFTATGGISDTVAHGVHVYLCLNGKTLTTVANGRLMTAYLSSGQSEMKLSVCDCRGGGIVTTSGSGRSSSQGGHVTLDANGRFYLYGGTLTNGKPTRYAGSVSVGSGKMYMYGGTITNCTAGPGDTSATIPAGGSIHVGAGELYIYDGTIEGGHANDGTYNSLDKKAYGGNIALDSGKIYMYDGVIRDGVSKNQGGNVRIGSGTFNMYGGSIYGGHSTKKDKNDALSANDAGGGNIAIEGGTFNMTGGSIYNGTADAATTLDGDGKTVHWGLGGNICIYSGKFNLSGTGKIYDGTASSFGGNVFLKGTFTMTDGLIAGGTVTAGNGGSIRVDTTSSLFDMSGGVLYGGTSFSNGNTIHTVGKVYISGNAVVAGTNTTNVAIATTNAAARVNISGGTLYKTNPGVNNRLIQGVTANGQINISGGILSGNIEGYEGANNITGGFISGTVMHTYHNSKGSLKVTGGYFSEKSTASILDMTGAWTVDSSTWIPFTKTVSYRPVSISANHEVTYGNEVSFTTNWAVTTCEQITGRNMTLNENLDLGLYTNVDLNEVLYKDGDNVGKISVTLNGETREAALTTLADHDATTKKFVFEGVTPELMGDTITVTLYASNGTTALDTRNYTIKEYLLTLKTENPSAGSKEEKMNALVDDLLVYGGQAQLKFNHNASNLVSDGVTGSGNAPISAVARSVWNKTEVTAQNYQDASVIPGYFKEATAIHESINWIRVLYKDNVNDGNTTFKIQKGTAAAEDVTLDQGYLCTEGLMPTEYDTKITFYAYRGGEEISKVEYSMNAYCLAKHNATGHEFSDALYNYGASVAAYAAAN